MNLFMRTFWQRKHVECTKAQINKLGSVSRFYKWCSTSSSPFAQVKSPCLMLSTLKDKATGEMEYSFFNPTDKKIIKFKKSSPLPKDARCFWSSQHWLAFVNPSDCGLYLWDPFISYSNPNYASTDVIRLPSIETLDCIAGVTYKSRDDDTIDMFKVRHPLACGHVQQVSPQELSKKILTSLAFSSAPSPYNNGCTVMAIQGSKANLAYCNLGDTTWTSLEGPLAPYCEITYSIIHQQFYAMGLRGEVESWDLRDLSCVKRIPIDNYRKLCQPRFTGLELAVRNKCFRRHNLVESSGDLLMVVRHFDDGTILSNNKDGNKKLPYQTLRCDVYKFDTSVGKWNYVKSLGDHAIFLGLTNPFMVRAQDYPGVRPNSIYFADDTGSEYYYFHREEYSYGGHDLGMFNLDDNSLEPFYPFGCLKSIKPPPFWVVPNLHLTKEDP